ncbi:MAG TPA: hypothetical protein VHN12_08560, partial [Geobacteraceae bacterium]|nr:hypothetical protein [Geobacteraceae bacterium]
MERALPIFRERHFALLFALARKHLPEKIREERTGFWRDEQPETPAEQPGALDPEERGAGKVRAADNPLSVKGILADWGEIVEVGIFFQGRFSIIPGLAELRVLHLQFELVDLKFM